MTAVLSAQGITKNYAIGKREIPVLRGVDLAIHAGDAALADSQLIARRLGSFHMVVCASPAYVKENGNPLAPEQLAKHNCLVFDSDVAYDHWEFSGHGREVSVQVAGNLHCNQGNALRIAALEGLGIVRLPSYMVEEDLRSRRLLELMPGYASPERALYAIYPDRRHQPAKVSAFIDFLAAHFQAPGKKNPRHLDRGLIDFAALRLKSAYFGIRAARISISINHPSTTKPAI